MMQQRLMRELKMFQSASSVSAEGLGLTLDPDMSGTNHDITKLTAIIFGPQDTPYCGGFFVFSVRIPADYPTQPPKVKIRTTNDGKLRFNPNFYSNGKVCVSVLNTFGSEEWTAALNLMTVFRSIQSMMTEDPFHNEPGFETCTRKGKGDCAAYAAKVMHEVLRVAVCDQLEQRTVPAFWLQAAVARFLADCDRHLAMCDTMSPQWDGTAFAIAPFEGSDNQAAGTFAFAQLKVRLTALRVALSQATPAAEPIAVALPALKVADSAAAAPVVPTVSVVGAVPDVIDVDASTSIHFRGPANPDFDAAVMDVLAEVSEGCRDGCEQLLAAIAFCLMDDPVVEPLAGLTEAGERLARVLGYVDAADGTLVLNLNRANRDHFEVALALLADSQE